MTLVACDEATFDLPLRRDPGSIHYSRNVCEVNAARLLWVDTGVDGAFLARNTVTEMELFKFHFNFNFIVDYKAGR